jgi:hypothetical protein
MAIEATSLNAREIDDALVLDVLVQPRASGAGLAPVDGDRLRVSVSAPPVEGAAADQVALAGLRAEGWIGAPAPALGVLIWRTKTIISSSCWFEYVFQSTCTRRA